MHRPKALINQLQSALEKGEDLSQLLSEENQATLLASGDGELLGRLLFAHGTQLLQNQGGSEQLDGCFDRLAAMAESYPILIEEIAVKLEELDSKPALEKAILLWGRLCQIATPQTHYWLYRASAKARSHGHLEEGEKPSGVELKEILDWLGIAEAKREELTESQQTLLDTRLARNWLQLARLEGEAYEWKCALRYYDRLLPETDEIASFWSEYGVVVAELAKLLNRTDLFEKVEAYYQKAVSLAPTEPLFHYQLAVHYFEAFSENWKKALFVKAEEQCILCRDLHCKAPQLFSLWGKLLLLQGQIGQKLELIERACDHLETALAYQPDQEEWQLDLAEAHLWLGFLSEELAPLHWSEVRLNKLLAIDPESERALHLQAELYREKGLYFSEEEWLHRSVKVYQALLKKRRGDAKAWHGLALVQSLLGEKQEEALYLKKACRSFEQALEFEPQQPPYFWNDWAISSMRLAELLWEPQPLHTALKLFEKAIEQDKLLNEGGQPTVELLYNYGCAIDLLGDLEGDSSCYSKSMALFEQVLTIDSSFTPALFIMAQTLSHWGEAEAEIEALEQSCRLFEQLALHHGEEELLWSDWGLALANMGLLIHEPPFPEKSEAYFAQAEEKIIRALSLGYEGARYQLGCLHALRGNAEEAIHQLQIAAERGVLPSVEEMHHDEWLHRLAGNEEFQRFLHFLKNR